MFLYRTKVKKNTRMPTSKISKNKNINHLVKYQIKFNKWTSKEIFTKYFSHLSLKVSTKSFIFPPTNGLTLIELQTN